MIKFGFRKLKTVSRSVLKNFACFVLIFALFAPAFVTSFADPLVVCASTKSDEERLAELKKKQNEASSNRAGQKKALDKLKKEAAEAKKNVNNLNRNIDQVKKEAAEAENGVLQTSKDIESLSQELSEAACNEEKQYKALKTQLAFMYENSLTQNMITILFSSKSISDFLTRSEYAIQIAKYDHELIESYKKTQEAIKNKSASLKLKQQELSAYQEILSAKNEELNGRLKDANAEFSAKAEAVNIQQANLNEIEKDIKGYKAETAAIEQRVAAEQLRLAEQIANSGGNDTTSTEGQGYGNDSEFNVLSALIYAEAGNQGYDGMLAVGSVIMNRVFHRGFPNTITGVVYQKGQFEPNTRLMVVRQNGKYVKLEITVLQYYVTHPEAVSENARKAARAVMNGERYHTPNGPMNQHFFMTPEAFNLPAQQRWFERYPVKDQFTLKNHTFFNTSSI